MHHIHLVIYTLGISCNIALKWMSQDLAGKIVSTNGLGCSGTLHNIYKSVE